MIAKIGTRHNPLNYRYHWVVVVMVVSCIDGNSWMQSCGDHGSATTILYLLEAHSLIIVVHARAWVIWGLNKIFKKSPSSTSHGNSWPISACCMLLYTVILNDRSVFKLTLIHVFLHSSTGLKSIIKFYVTLCIQEVSKLPGWHTAPSPYLAGTLLLSHIWLPPLLTCLVVNK